MIEGVTNRLIEIDRTLSTLGATSTSLQDRLFGIVERQFSIAEQTGQVTVKASDQIKGLINQELSNSKVVTADNMARVEEKVDRVLSELSAQLLELTQKSNQATNAAEIRQLEEGVNLEGTKSKIDEATIIEVGGLRLDKQNGVVWVDGSEVRLSPMTYDLLTLFMENTGKVITGDDIVRALYGDTNNVDTNIVFTLISRLRNAIDPERKYLRSVRGRGFILDSGH